MQRRSFVLAAAAAAMVGAMCGPFAGPAQAQWKPDRPITIIVPWAAGGSTDQVTRARGRGDREGARRRRS